MTAELHQSYKTALTISLELMRDTTPKISTEVGEKLCKLAQALRNIHKIENNYEIR